MTQRDSSSRVPQKARANAGLFSLSPGAGGRIAPDGALSLTDPASASTPAAPSDGPPASARSEDLLGRLRDATKSRPEPGKRGAAPWESVPGLAELSRQRLDPPRPSAPTAPTPPGTNESGFADVATGPRAPQHLLGEVLTAAGSRPAPDRPVEDGSQAIPAAAGSASRTSEGPPARRDSLARLADSRQADGLDRGPEVSTGGPALGTIPNLNLAQGLSGQVVNGVLSDFRLAAAGSGVAGPSGVGASLPEAPGPAATAGELDGFPASARQQVMGQDLAWSGANPSIPASAAGVVPELRAGSLLPAMGTFFGLPSFRGVAAAGRETPGAPTWDGLSPGQGTSPPVPWGGAQGASALDQGVNDRGSAVDLSRTNALLEQLLDEVRRGRQPFLPLSDRSSAYPSI